MEVYKDSEGRECTLQELCRKEPEWAHKYILALQQRVSDLKFALGMDATGWFDRYQATKLKLDVVTAERDRWAVRFKDMYGMLG